MNRSLLAALALSAMTSVSAGEKVTAGSQRGTEASQALARARSAIASERNVEGIRAIVAKGRRLARNQWYGPGNRAPEFTDNPVELRILFPDYFMRIMGRGLAARMETTGFRGRDGLDGGPAPDFERSFVACLMLGALMRSDAVVPLSLDRRSTASVLTFTGGRHVPIEVLLDPATGLPSKLRYTDRRADDGRRMDVEWRLEEHRMTAGVNLPHRVTRDVDGRRFDVYVFESWIVDAPLTRDDFVLGR
jgi:hypothetical protein